MSLSKISKFYSRTLLHVDIDSCEIQNLKRNADLNRAIIAVNSKGLVLSATKAAKALGISRPSYPNLDWLRNRYPWLDILEVPDDKWGKPESKSKRLASFKIMKIVIDFFVRKGGSIIEMNSLDDMIIDVTAVADAMAMKRNYNLANFNIPKLSKAMRLEVASGTIDRTGIRACILSGRADVNMNLIMGALLAQELSNEILLKTGFKVSMGLGRNKTLAKVATSLHRPRGITILPRAGYFRVTENVSAKKLNGLGGDRGRILFNAYEDDLTIADLRQIPFNTLVQYLGQELAQNVSPKLHAHDHEPVEYKTMHKSVSCGKTLDFNNCSNYMVDEITKLCEEMLERNLQEEVVFNKRIGIRFKMDVTSWFACHPNYSCSVCICPNGVENINGDEMADEIIDGLQQDGFWFGNYYAKRLTLSVTQFVDYPPAISRCY